MTIQRPIRINLEIIENFNRTFYRLNDDVHVVRPNMRCYQRPTTMLRGLFDSFHNDPPLLLIKQEGGCFMVSLTRVIDCSSEGRNGVPGILCSGSTDPVFAPCRCVP